MSVSIRNVVNKLNNPVQTIEGTVDALLFGDPDATVQGVAIAFMATHHVIDQAIAKGANLLVTHEGVFYSHRGDTEILLKKDSVYLEKLRDIKESGLSIFRFHDYWHRRHPDGVMNGLIQTLGFESYVEQHQPVFTILEMPPRRVVEVAMHIKERLGVSFVRVVGDVNVICRRVGVLVGYRGSGEMAIPLFENERLDLMIYGEGPEWETPEYVRDAVYQGKQRALVILGHAESEAPGMKYLAEYVRTLFPGLPVHFIPETPAFKFI